MAGPDEAAHPGQFRRRQLTGLDPHQRLLVIASEELPTCFSLSQTLATPARFASYLINDTSEARVGAVPSTTAAVLERRA